MTTWIFQGNPKEFHIDDYLKNNDEITWTIRQKQYTSDIKIGDKVFIGVLTVE
jgi:hypothetical protein